MLGLASCGSDDGVESDAVSETNFESKLLAALCDVAPCCSARQLAYESGGCEARWSAAIAQMGEPSDGQAFDPKVAAECLAKVGEVTGSCSAPTLGLSGACMRVWHDDAQPGEACGSVGDCTSQPGSLTLCSETCAHVPRGAEGAPCQASCTLGLGEDDRVDVCFEPSSGSVAAVDPAGAALCLLDEGLECVAGSGGAATCTKVEGWAGSACSSTTDCAGGHFCSAAKLCTPDEQAGKELDGYGSACSSSGECADPYVCIVEPHEGSSGGRCALPRDVTALDCSGAATTVDPL